jgi:hypothetical protein
MDIISHALWSGALFESVNLKLKKRRFNLWWAAFWGTFPDVFAFVIPYIIFSIIIISQNGFNITNLITTIKSPAYESIVIGLYSISHSLIIFAAVFLLTWLIFRKPIWILFGWLSHILIDIPTHTIGHYATPMFWPISNFKINGIAYWREPIVMIVDITLLIIIYWIILRKERKIKNRRR